MNNDAATNSICCLYRFKTTCIGIAADCAFHRAVMADWTTPWCQEKAEEVTE